MVVTSVVQAMEKPLAPKNSHLGQEREGAAQFLPSEKGKSPVTFTTRGWGWATSPHYPPVTTLSCVSLPRADPQGPLWGDNRAAPGGFQHVPGDSRRFHKGLANPVCCFWQQTAQYVVRGWRREKIGRRSDGYWTAAGEIPPLGCQPQLPQPTGTGTQKLTEHFSTAAASPVLNFTKWHAKQMPAEHSGQRRITGCPAPIWSH